MLASLSPLSVIAILLGSLVLTMLYVGNQLFKRRENQRHRASNFCAVHVKESDTNVPKN